MRSIGALEGRRALVTGASRNLGAEIARRLADLGAAVAVGYHADGEAADQVVSSLAAPQDGSHCTVAGDVGDPEQANAVAADAVRGLGGHVDILVNNAGPFGITPLVEIGETEWDRVWDANVKAIYLLVRELAPAMRDAGWGRVVNLSAVSAYVRNRSVYGLAKAAVNMLTEELAAELAPEITVNAVAPGQILESLEDLAEFKPGWAETVTAATPLGRLATRREVADVVAMLCTPVFDAVTGATIPIDGGLRLNRF